MEASENKTDRKLDILSRAIPTPGLIRRRDETPSNDGDTSMEQSFESAEQSLLASEDASFDQISDPFLMPAKIVPRLAEEDEDEDEEDEGSDTVSESENDDEDEDEEEAVIATLSSHRRDTVRPAPAVADVSMESEDPLAAMDHMNVSMEGDGSSDLTDDDEEEGNEEPGSEEDENDDDDEEEDDSEEEEDEEVADDEDEGVEGESSFAASTATSDTASASDSDSDVYSDRGRGKGRDSDESAVGRGATQRRKSGSPIKKSRPSAPSTSKVKAAPAPKAARLSVKKVKSPLQEKMVQDVIEISDDEEIVAAVKTPQKKRYVLSVSIICSPTHSPCDLPLVPTKSFNLV